MSRRSSTRSIGPSPPRKHRNSRPQPSSLPFYRLTISGPQAILPPSRLTHDALALPEGLPACCNRPTLPGAGTAGVIEAAGTQDRRSHPERPFRVHDRADRRPAAGRAADHGRVRRRGPALRRRFVRLERPCQEAARRKAAPHRAAGRHRRRRPVRPADRLRRQDDVPRGHDVVRRLALRRGAAEHLEADRHRRRRRGRPARRVVPGQDADRLRQRPARALSRARRLDLLVQGGLRRADLRAAGQAAVRHPGGAHLPLPARRHRASSRS